MSGRLRAVVGIAVAASLLSTGAARAGTPGADDEARFTDVFKAWQKADRPERAGRTRQRPASAQRLVAVRRPAAPEAGGTIITSGMGMRVNPVLGRRMFHAGADLAAQAGTAVRATADAVVGTAGWHGGYGLLVTLRHESGYETRYGHMSRVIVTPGQSVAKGQVIGFVGSTGRSTGPHLHYEVRHNGQVADPVRYMRR